MKNVWYILGPLPWTKVPGYDPVDTAALIYNTSSVRHYGWWPVFVRWQH